jgi:hypothetical protein
MPKNNRAFPASHLLCQAPLTARLGFMVLLCRSGFVRVAARGIGFAAPMVNRSWATRLSQLFQQVPDGLPDSGPSFAS